MFALSVTYLLLCFCFFVLSLKSLDCINVPFNTNYFIAWTILPFFCVCRTKEITNKTSYHHPTILFSVTCCSPSLFLCSEDPKKQIKTLYILYKEKLNHFLLGNLERNTEYNPCFEPNSNCQLLGINQ